MISLNFFGKQKQTSPGFMTTFLNTMYIHILGVLVVCRILVSQEGQVPSPEVKIYKRKQESKK